MSDGYKRKHESGSEKRKKKAAKEETIKQMKDSLLQFMTTETKENNTINLTECELEKEKKTSEHQNHVWKTVLINKMD